MLVRRMVPADPMAVEELVRRAGRGDARAFEKLLARHQRLGLAVAYGILQDAQGAGDVVQDAAVKAWKKLGSLSQPASFGAWFCGIVRNLCVDRRRRRPEPTCGLDHAAGQADPRTGDPAETMGQGETRRRIDEALASLDEVTRCAVVLRYYEDLSSRQIGEALGLSPAAVDMRLMRGRQALKEKLALEVCE